MQLEEEKTLHMLPHRPKEEPPSLEHLGLKPARILQQKREEPSSRFDKKTKEVSPETPPRPNRPSLTLSDYSKVERANKYLTYKQKPLSQEKEKNEFSLQGLQLPPVKLDDKEVGFIRLC